MYSMCEGPLQDVIRIPLPPDSGSSSDVNSASSRHDSFNQLLSTISARLVRSPNEVLDDEIQQAIREGLKPLGVDRGGLLEVVQGSPIVRVSHVWYDEGVEQVSTEVNLAAMFPWSYQKLVVEGRTLAVEDCSALPAEAEQDRESHRLLGNLSTLTIPLFIGDRVHHLVTVDAHQAKREWPDEMVTNLLLLGEIFVSALQRRDADLALSQTRDRLDLAAASADAALWELDFATGELWVTDKARQMFGYTQDIQVTLDNFMEKVHVDDRPLIVEALESLSSDQMEIKVEYRTYGTNEPRWMYSRGRLLSHEHNGKKRLAGVTLDISQRKRMELQVYHQLQEIEQLRNRLEAENSYLRNELGDTQERQKISSGSNRMQGVMSQVEQVTTTDSTVLIQGETGTGKELVAQMIHQSSERRKRVMVKVNCAALPAALVESELFGREKGAFTGALSRQAGRFELANGSTLFLDEIAEMPLDIQAKLLRVLQEGEFERLGSPQTIKVDVRVIAASNRDLADEVRHGRFRRDLYYRLNVFPIQVPPLRERVEDIPNLVWEFINELGELMGKKIRRISQRDMEVLKSQPWPGNVRELRNVIEHALIISKGDTLELQRLSGMAPISLPSTLEEVERQHIQDILSATHGRIKGMGGAAECLGLHPSTLYSRMRKLGIQTKSS